MKRRPAGASTEPRPRGRGSPGSSTQQPRLLQASTEPRPRGRGSQDSHHDWFICRELQRSPDLVVGDRYQRASRARDTHGFNGAPTSWSGIAVSPCVVWLDELELQRSPDLVVGDRRPIPGCRSTCRSCFNGAPTSWSGIVADSDVLTDAPAELQRSPDLVVGDRSSAFGPIDFVCRLQRSPDLVVGDRHLD